MREDIEGYLRRKMRPSALTWEQVLECSRGEDYADSLLEDILLGLTEASIIPFEIRERKCGDLYAIGVYRCGGRLPVGRILVDKFKCKGTIEEMGEYLDKIEGEFYNCNLINNNDYGDLYY